MSSLLGHVAAGLAIHSSQGSKGQRQGGRSWRVLLLLIFLANLPDFDYLAVWFFGIKAQFRITHSIFFCTCAGLLAGMTVKVVGAGRLQVSMLALLVAGYSHLLLDYCVGVHTLPLFWPFVSNEVQPSVGLLPSAGRLHLYSYYLWRNLLIECGVLWPLFYAIVSIRNGTFFKWNKAIPVMGSMLWLGFLVWSIKTH